jgi:uncharacterized protein (DUF362 family)
MSINVELKCDKSIPSEIKGFLEVHYPSLLGSQGEKYAEERWKEIVALLSPVFYRVLIDGVPAGWVVINRDNSTIMELCMDEGHRDRGVEPLVLDKVIEEHKLISFEVPKSDGERYQSLKAFGFRPTREFTLYGIPMIHMDLSTAVYLEKLKEMKGTAYQGREVVGIEKIAETQTDDEIKKGLENLIEKLGGLNKFVKEGQSVVLKPNLVSDHGLRDGVKKGGIATDIRVMQAMVELLAPVAGKIIIAEGSSINRSETMKIFEHYGFDKIEALYPEKVSLVDLNSDECVEKAIPDGRRLEKRNVPKTLLDADVIINMPVLKLHFAAGASLSIKNFQGAIPPLEKYKVHFFGLWQNLINTYKIIMPDLIIMDGLYGQEDFGPVSGSPRKMDLLIGGTNPVAVDTVALKIMGLEVEDSPPVLMACHEGLGPVEWDRIEVRGPSVDEVSQHFKRPLLNLESGRCFKIHEGEACSGCKGYLHFVLNKLRRPDPLHEGELLIDRPFEKNINVCIGPQSGDAVNPDETNIFMGICQQHHADSGSIHLPGCPPHTEEIINGIFQFYKDVDRPKYADQTEEAKLGELLKSTLESQKCR